MFNPVPFVSQLTEAKSFAVLGDIFSILATGENTSGQYALFHAVIFPGGGPPPHVHRREDGFFYILDGEITFVIAGQKIVGGPGTFIHLSRGTVFQFKNEGSKPAKVLMQVLPAGLEKFFEEVGQIVSGPSASPPSVTLEDASELLAVIPRFGIELEGNLENPSSPSG